MASGGRVILVCLLVAAAFAILSFQNSPHLDFKTYRGQIGLDYSQASMPISAGNITIEVQPGDAQRITAVEVQVHGDALFHVDSKSVDPSCSEEGAFNRCRIILFHGKEIHNIHIDAKDNKKEIRLENLTFSVLKESRLTAASYVDLFYVWASLVALIPALWLAHKNKSLSQWMLVIFSSGIIFYIQPLFSIVLIGYLVTSHFIGTRFSKGRGKILWLLFAGSIFILIFFKYIGEDVIGIFLDPGDFGLVLPLGMSYFLIRAIDTQVNWYRGLQCDVSIREYLSYIMFPATLPAGPIDTLSNFRSGRSEKISKDDVLYGVTRIIVGLFKKIVIADYLLFRPLYGSDGLFYGIASLLEIEAGHEIIILLVGSFLFVYFDFSAYSDIAIGLGRCMGYRVPENFNLPIIANSIRDYWKRWHMSLTGWCMRNIYFPLLIMTRHVAIPAYMVMLAVGMWHSFTASWFLWAVHHGTAIAVQGKIEEKTKGYRLTGVHPFLKRVVMVGIVIVWVSAGHAFAQIHDPSVALDLYWAYWKSFFLF